MYDFWSFIFPAVNRVKWWKHNFVYMQNIRRCDLSCIITKSFWMQSFAILIPFSKNNKNLFLRKKYSVYMYNYVSNNFWFTFLASVQDCDVNNPSNREKSFCCFAMVRKFLDLNKPKYIYILYWLVWLLCAWLHLGTKWSPTFPLSFDFANDRLCQERLGWFSNRTGTSVDDGNAHGKDWKRLPVHNIICHSAIGQASCLVCTYTRQLTFPFCC